jgi:XTP/dITP diphosphohydrolase
MPLVVLGTHNRKKGAEVAELLAPLGIRLATLDQFSGAIHVVEDGDSFAANARLKAGQQARQLHRWVLGEDSGLEVDALGGAPGIYSARYSGPDATDEANNMHLLAQLGALPLERRTARYVCWASLADPSGQIRAESDDICRGRIRTQPSGTAGFGYDPLFEVVEYHRTFGQLGAAVKSMISHRARALRKLRPLVEQLLRSGELAD